MQKLKNTPAFPSAVVSGFIDGLQRRARDKNNSEAFAPVCQAVAKRFADEEGGSAQAAPVIGAEEK